MNQSVVEWELSQINQRLKLVENIAERANETIRGTSSLISSINLEKIAFDIEQTTSRVIETVNSVTANGKPALSCLLCGNDSLLLLQSVEWPGNSSRWGLNC